MARRSDAFGKCFNVSVVGLSGTERDKGSLGSGKSCLCNRFVRPHADDYYTDHISVLSQTDFSGRVVNNDHFLYWGEVTKTAEDGSEFNFQVVEQTEFIDDASFQTFKGGKTDPYFKRCCATKLSSAEKLMYICKNQLGIEKEYEEKLLPDGKITIDGFLCVFDVSVVQNRSLDRQSEYTVAILNSIMRTKKPVVLVTSKNDEANELYIREAERLVARKEFKGSIPLVETSAHENVNVDLAFVILAQLVDKSRTRLRIIPYVEAARHRKEILDACTENFQRLVRSQVTDFRTSWALATKKIFAQHRDFLNYCDLMGRDSAQRLFKRHVKKLKDDFIQRKLQGYLEMLPDVLMEFFPDLSSLEQSDWNGIREQIMNHPDFHLHFVDAPLDEMDLLETTDSRIPVDLLESIDAETCFRNHINALLAERKRLQLREDFKKLLEDSGYVTPGKGLSEVQVLFMGRECFEALPTRDVQEVYDLHQREIIDRARQNFQELLLEYAELFSQYRNSPSSSSGSMTQDDVRHIQEALQEDSRYKALDRLEQDRKLMLLQHLGFVYCPLREHCPSYPNCIDAVIERILATKVQRSSGSWTSGMGAPPGPGCFNGGISNHVNLVLLGATGLAQELAAEIRAQCDDDELEVDGQLYSLDTHVIEGDVNLPQNVLHSTDFTPQGILCVYSSSQTLEYLNESLEKTLLSNLEQGDRLPFQGIPILILFGGDPALGEAALFSLQEAGQSLAQSQRCEFVSVNEAIGVVGRRVHPLLVQAALQKIVPIIKDRGLLPLLPSPSLNLSHNILAGLQDPVEPDFRVMLCMLCGDPFSVENVLSPLLNHPGGARINGGQSLLLDTFLGDAKRGVEVLVSSYHGASAFRDDLIHGFILVYSTKRKASLANLTAFSNHIPHLPIQILAVTEGGGANAFFSSDLSHQLITEGNNIADKLQAHFTTSAATTQQKTAFYSSFFREVWEKKPEIEQALELEERSLEGDSGEGTLERPRALGLPRPPNARRNPYRTRSASADGSGGSESLYERLPADGSPGDDLEEPLSPTGDEGVRSSDDSEAYSPLLTRDRRLPNDHEEALVKPSQLKKKILKEGYREGYPSPGSRSITRQKLPPPPTAPPPPPPSTGDTELHYHVSTIIQQGPMNSPPPPYHAFSSPYNAGATARHVSRYNFTNAVGSRHSDPLSHVPFYTASERGEYGYACSTLFCGGSKATMHQHSSPPEPAPPDFLHLRRLRKATTLPSDSGANSDDNLPTWVDDSNFWRRAEELPSGGRSMTLGRNKSRPSPTSNQSKGKSPHTLKQPGKLNLDHFSNITDAIARLNLENHGKPPPPDIPKAKESGYGQFDGAFSYLHGDGKPRLPARRVQRKEKSRPSYSESESDATSPDCLVRPPLTIPQGPLVPNPAPGRKPRSKKKRAAIPVAMPTVPSVGNPPSGYKASDASDIARSQSASEDSDVTDHQQQRPRRRRSLRAKKKSSTTSSSSATGTFVPVPSPVQPTKGNSSASELYSPSSKGKGDEVFRDEEGVPSPQDSASPLLGPLPKSKSVSDATAEQMRRKEKERKKEEEKRAKKEKEKERLAKKQSKKGKSAAIPSFTVEDFVQSDTNPIPLFVEKCVQFIEDDGLDSEGVYRVPGNRAQVDLLLQKFDEDPNLSIVELDIPMNAVATALKEFFAKRLPPLLPPETMEELARLGEMPDKSLRLLHLRDLLKRLPQTNFHILKYMFQHFVKITEKCKVNSMDSRNLAICWWPTLLPYEFKDMGLFERMRPHLEDAVQTMIDQFPFIFCGKEEVLRV